MIGTVAGPRSSRRRNCRPSWIYLSLVRYAETVTVAFFLFITLALHSYRGSSRSASLEGQRDIVLVSDLTEQKTFATELMEVWKKRLKLAKENGSCESLAHTQREPYTAKYRNQTIDLAGPVYAYHSWEGVTPKIEIEKYQIEIQRNASLDDCRLIFKIYENQLYVHEESYCYNQLLKRDIVNRYKAAREMIMAALEVYNLPNMDFTVTIMDEVEEFPEFPFPLPTFAYCLRCGDDVKPGFTLPAYSAYMRAKGDIQVCMEFTWGILNGTQMAFYRECLNQRYPLENRIRKAVWRGCTTGHLLRAYTDVKKNRRVQFAHRTSQMPDLFDAGIYAYVQMEDADEVIVDFVKSYVPKKNFLPMEIYNNYAAVMDIDGNSWSERLSGLLVANTPVLKQGYDTWIEHFGHLLEDDVHVKFFNPDFSDLASIAAEMTDPDVFTLEDAEERVRNQLDFAREHLSQLGVFRATAYALLKMKSYTTWEVTMEEGYVKIPPQYCCSRNEHLPKELVTRIQSRQA